LETEFGSRIENELKAWCFIEHVAAFLASSTTYIAQAHSSRSRQAAIANWRSAANKSDNSPQPADTLAAPPIRLAASASVDFGCPMILSPAGGAALVAATASEKSELPVRQSQHDPVERGRDVDRIGEGEKVLMSLGAANHVPKRNSSRRAA